MLREKMLETKNGETYFRWRGGDVSRLEGLTDAVIALSLTLLIVSVEVPRTFDELTAAFVQLPVFAACFAVLYMIWIYHFQFHRRYGLEDGWTIFLNAVLLFLILFYAFPLKFLFTTLYTLILHGDAWVLDSVGEPATTPGGDRIAAVEVGDMASLMIVYGAGFGGIFLVMALKTWHAWRLKDELGLDATERVVTRWSIGGHLIQASFGAFSLLIVLIDDSLAAVSGMLYALIGPVMGLHGWRASLAAERTRARE